jgi:hypothetical protein
MAFASNCRISGPVRVASPAHVDFNGLQWSYTIGLMFPPQAATMTVPAVTPNQTQLYTPGG